MASTTTNLNDPTQAVRALEAEFLRNANAGDAVKLTEGFYTNDATLLPPASPPVIGKAKIVEFWQAFLAAGPSDVTLETGPVRASGELAYGVGKYGVTVAGARQEGKYLVVYQRQADGSYKAIADMFSANA